MPTVITRGAMTASGYGFGASTTIPVYVEDVFSTWLYTGNSTTGGSQTITNNIDLSTKGGLVWIKGRSAAANHILTDTTRGAGTSAANNQALTTISNLAEDLGASTDYLSAFSNNGFTVTQGGSTTANRGTNYNNVTYVSWSFRKQAKFFDIVTYTGNATNSRAITHSLGSTPGCIIIKSQSTGDWWVWHRAYNSGNGYGQLNSTGQFGVAGGLLWGDGTTYSAPTSTTFTISAATEVNTNGASYVAYIFAHNAGGFGATGTDNVISCGSFTTDASGNATVNLGYEPQLLIFKRTNGAGNWTILDNMRGWSLSTNDAQLQLNLAGAETSASNLSDITNTGFIVAGISASSTYIYVAIRRGPMKIPTVATSVFALSAFTGTLTTGTFVTTNFVTDLAIGNNRLGGNHYFVPRLTVGELYTNGTNIESAGSSYWDFSSNIGFTDKEYGATTDTCVDYGLARAPGFFDVVCYTGTGVATAFSHNLGVLPEFMIWKSRSAVQRWDVWHKDLGIYSGDSYRGLTLNTTNAVQNSGIVKTSTLTSTSWTAPAGGETNTLNVTQVMYLFASVAGVSKVGSYTGNGTNQTVNCGFSAGARFIMIKRTDSTGDWYIWDTARGIVAANDPHLSLNTTAAEVTTDDSIDTDASGFIVNQLAATNINVNNGTYIFLAIA